MKLHKDQTLPGPFASPWLVIVGTVLLGLTVGLTSMSNSSRNADNMARILEAKGASLIKSLEAGARTDLRGSFGAEIRMQTLIEEMATQPDIQFIMITDHAGRILAHSNTNARGIAFGPEDMESMLPKTGVGWWLVDSGQRRSFVVFREFEPLTGRKELRDVIEQWHRDHNIATPERRGMGHDKRGHGQGRRMGPRNMIDPVFPFGAWLRKDSPPPVIFVGLDITPFEQAQESDREHMWVMIGFMVLIGFAGVVSLIWAQSVRKSSRLLQDSQALAAEVVTNLPDGLVMVDASGNVAFLNAVAEEQLGVTLATSRGSKPGATLPPVISQSLQEVAQVGHLVDTELECQLGDVCIPLGISGVRIATESGDHVGEILILRDLREVRSLQQEVRRKEKLAAIGSLAAGVAHEIRNPLSSIKGYATYLGTRFPEGSEDRQATRIMVQEVDRLNRVITDLIGLARPSDLKTQAAHAGILAEHAVRLIRPEAKAQGVSLEMNVADTLPPMQLDPDRFTQALLNICLNSLEAMPNGGSLSITLENQSGELALHITDTGEGMSEDVVARVFDPYYTTKGQGTGLGLPIVHKIVEAHGGRVDVTSTLGEGTEFTIRIPIVAGEADNDERDFTGSSESTD